MFLQRIYMFFSYIREKICKLRCGFEKSYLPVSENDSENLNDNQYTVFFDAENGMMYNKL